MEIIVDENFLENTKAINKIFKKNDVVIQEGKISGKYFYLKRGELGVFNLNEDGKEFLQHKVMEEHFFGEPAVLLETSFPGTVRVETDSAEVIIFNKEDFENYMLKNPEKLLLFTKSVARKSIRKSNTLKNLIFNNPEDRILNQLQSYKRENSLGNEKKIIPLTRKEISNMTGLRIETVIRTIKKMEAEGKIELKDSKIFF